MYFIFWAPDAATGRRVPLMQLKRFPGMAFGAVAGSPFLVCCGVIRSAPMAGIPYLKRWSRKGGVSGDTAIGRGRSVPLILKRAATTSTPNRPEF